MYKIFSHIIQPLADLYARSCSHEVNLNQINAVKSGSACGNYYWPKKILIGQLEHIWRQIWNLKCHWTTFLFYGVEVNQSFVPNFGFKLLSNRDNAYLGILFTKVKSIGAHFWIIQNQCLLFSKNYLGILVDNFTMDIRLLPRSRTKHSNCDIPFYFDVSNIIACKFRAIEKPFLPRKKGFPLAGICYRCTVHGAAAFRPLTSPRSQPFHLSAWRENCKIDFYS